MKTVRKSPSQDDKVSWWYWFEKLDGNRAKCKNCDWLRDRGPAKSTSILRCHLKSKHSELYDQRMEAQATTPNPEQRGRKRRMMTLGPATTTTTMNRTWTEGVGVQQRTRRRQQQDIVKSTFDLLDKVDEDDFSTDNVDAIAHTDEQQQTSSYNYDNNEDDGVNETLTQNLELSHAMLMFMNTLGAENDNNKFDIVSSTLSNKKRQQSTSRATDLVGGSLLSAANPKTETSNVSSNLMVSNNNNLPPLLNSLPMLIEQSSVASETQLQQQASPIVKMCRVETFSAAHRLHNDNLPNYLNREVFGKCNNGNGHGHNYTWKVVLKGPVNQHTGMVYNLADLKREMNEVLEQVDHKHLDKDVPYFRDNAIVSTTENLCVFLYNELFAKMRSPELLHKVTVCETDKNCFSFAGYSS